MGPGVGGAGGAGSAGSLFVRDFVVGDLVVEGFGVACLVGTVRVGRACEAGVWATERGAAGRAAMAMARAMAGWCRNFKRASA
jgi:hypothetical protein